MPICEFCIRSLAMSNSVRRDGNGLKMRCPIRDDPPLSAYLLLWSGTTQEDVWRIPDSTRYQGGDGGWRCKPDPRRSSMGPNHNKARVAEPETPDPEENGIEREMEICRVSTDRALPLLIIPLFWAVIGLTVAVTVCALVCTILVV